MKKGKKDFLYNPTWRVSVYAISGIFMFCFKLFVLVCPKMERYITRFEAGENNPAAYISFSSGLIFTLAFLLLTYKQLSLNYETAISFTLLYVFVSLMGFISLIRFRDYQRENRQKR